MAKMKERGAQRLKKEMRQARDWDDFDQRREGGKRSQWDGGNQRGVRECGLQNMRGGSVKNQNLDFTSNLDDDFL